MKLNEDQLKVYIEDIADASVNILKSYDLINDMIKLCEINKQVLREYDFGTEYGSATYYDLLLACKARIMKRMSILKNSLDVLLDAYEDSVNGSDEDETCDCDCGCNGVCMDCNYYEATSWDLFNILGFGSDEDDEDEDEDDIVFNLSLDPDSVDKDTFKAIVESIYKKVYEGDTSAKDTDKEGTKRGGRRDPIDEYIKFRNAKDKDNTSATKPATTRKRSTSRKKSGEEKDTDNKKKK